jgi:tRNA(Arg) A34 adenosine deaminase TadA
MSEASFAGGRILRHLLEAAAVAEGSSLEIKHGAVIVRGGKLIGRGCNSDRSRLAAIAGAVSDNVSLHSEVAALHDARRWVL